MPAMRCTTTCARSKKWRTWSAGWKGICKHLTFYLKHIPMSNKTNEAERFWLLAGAAVTLGLAARQYHAGQARRAWRQASAAQGQGTALVTGASSGIGAEF